MNEQKQIKPPPSDDTELVEPPKLTSDQKAYQAAFHQSLGEAIGTDYDHRTDDDIAAELGQLEGRANHLRDLLERRRHEQ